MASEASDIAAIKAQLSVLQHDYDGRIRALEKRLARTESELKVARAQGARPVAVASTAAPQTAQTFDQTAPEPAAPDTAPQDGVADSAPPPAAPPASNNAFNPGIAAVLNGFYVASSRDTQKQTIRGFAAGGEAGLPLRGFSLGESEGLARGEHRSVHVGLPGLLDGGRQFALGRGGLHPLQGFALWPHRQAGRFLSGIGYLNERHAHDWTFSTRPCPIAPS